MLCSFHPHFIICSLSCFFIFKNDVKKYTGIDMSKAMLDSAKIMTSGIGSPLVCTFYEKSTSVINRIKTSNERFDMVICAYTLTELTSDPGRLIATQFLFDALEIHGMIVIVERGNPLGSHTVRTARKVLLDKFNKNSSSTAETEGTVSFVSLPSGHHIDVQM